jgi:hypothetical protein
MLNAIKVIPKISRMLVKTRFTINGKKPVPRRIFRKTETFAGTGFI